MVCVAIPTGAIGVPGRSVLSGDGGYVAEAVMARGPPAGSHSSSV